MWNLQNYADKNGYIVMVMNRVILKGSNFKRASIKLLYIFSICIFLTSCSDSSQKSSALENEVTQMKVNAADILSDPNYLAISYGGYRENSRDIQPTLDQLKEDLLILNAMGIKVLRTYNVKLKHASNVLEAIRQLKNQDPEFEMYVMLGAWINCENAFTDKPNHENEDELENGAEIERAVGLANEYPEIVKIIAVGNEAMVKWAASYYVQPKVILKWVTYLQDLKKNGKLAKDLWITSSDNFASWGGGEAIYHTPDLEALIKEVDYISMHTYPMHDTHYNPDFWGVPQTLEASSKIDKIDAAMEGALAYAVSQFESVNNYMRSLGIEKPIHIGETGWASYSNGFYGTEGSKATDEYKEALYYQKIRKWSNDRKVACFYFEAFDEIWKDAGNPGGSENYFGLFTIKGEAKYALWNLVDEGVFEGLQRGNNPIVKTYNGDFEELFRNVAIPDSKKVSE